MSYGINELTIHYITKPFKLENIVNEFLLNGLSRDNYAGLDTEGTGLDPHSSEIRLVQIAVSDSEVYVIDRFKIGREFTDIQLIKLFSNDKRTTYIAHNLKYDVKMFWSTKVDLSKTKVFDTMLADQIINAGVIYEFSLAEVSERLLRISVDKTEQRSDWSVSELSSDQLTYAAIDAIRVRQIARIQLKGLKNADLANVFKLEMRALFPLAAMEFFGIRVDTDKLTSRIKPLYQSFFNQAQIDFLSYFPDRYIRKNLYGDVIDEGIEVTSSTQVLKALQTLKIPDPLELFPVIQSTGKDIIGLLDLEEYPVIEPLLKHRLYSKALSSYVYAIPQQINAATGRLHPYFNQCVSTGRVSSNWQQMPRPQGNLDESIRSCFIPEYGYKFVACIPENTRVITNRGLIEIKYLQVNVDEVLQEDGSFKPVLAKVNKGLGQVYTITLANGTRMQASPTHKFRVWTSKGYEWKDVKDLLVDDVVVLSLQDSLSKIKGSVVKFNFFNESKRTKTHITYPEILTEDLACLVGYILGDGSLKGNSSVKIVVAEQDLDIKTYVDSLFVDYFNYFPRWTNYRGVWEAGIYNVNANSWVGLTKELVNKERIPYYIWNAPKSFICAFLRGLFEADGSISTHSTSRVSFTCKHETLADDVLDLLLLNGILARKRNHITKLNGKLFPASTIAIYSEYLDKFRQDIGFISARKKQKLDIVCSRGHRGFSSGGMPVLIEGIKLPRPLFANYLNRGDNTSEAKANEVEVSRPDLYNQLELWRLNKLQQRFSKITSVSLEPVPICLFDITVQDTSTYLLQNSSICHNSDYSQVELRVIAEIIYQTNGDSTMLDEFLQGKDPYANTAALLSGMSYEQLVALDKPEYKRRRQNAKPVRLGYSYAMGAKKFKNYAQITYGVKMSQKEAETSRKLFFEAYPGLSKYHQMFSDPRTLETFTLPPFNRRRRWLEYPGVSGLSNAPVQGSSADMTKLAMAALYEELYDAGYSPTQSHDIKPLLQIHDELVLESTFDKLEYSKTLMSTTMINAGEVILKYCPVLAEAQVMDNLSQKG